MADDFLSSLLQALLPAATGEQPTQRMSLGGDPVGRSFSPAGALTQPPDQKPDGVYVQATTPERPAIIPDIPNPKFDTRAPVTDEIKRLFAADQQPPRSVMPSSARMPQTGMAPPTQEPEGITAADVQRFIRSVATGAGKADPRAPGMAAFAQGAMGSLQNSYGETEREKAQKLAERRADTADRRADTALQLGERRERRAEDELARRTKRDEQVEAERQVRMRERLARIAKIDDQRLDSKDIGRIGDQVNRHARYLQVEVNNARMTPEQAEQSLQQYKRDVIEQYVKRDPAAKAPPVGAQPPAGTQPPIQRYNGIQYRLKPGADPTKQESYEKVN